MVPSACCSLSGIAHASQNSPGRPGEVAACRPRLCGIRGGQPGSGRCSLGSVCAFLALGWEAEGLGWRGQAVPPSARGICARARSIAPPAWGAAGDAHTLQAMPELPRRCPSSPGHAQAPQAMPTLPRPCPSSPGHAHAFTPCPQHPRVPPMPRHKPRSHPAGAGGRWAAGASPQHLAAGGGGWKMGRFKAWVLETHREPAGSVPKGLPGPPRPCCRGFPASGDRGED